jgi:hypothetical protein
MCRPGDGGRLCGHGLGWLTGRPGKGFRELTYAIEDRSDARIAVLYRETMLARSGAPADRSQPSLRWRPRLCVDGLCVAGETAAFGIPALTQVYYPRRNQLVTAWPLSFYAPDAFRRRGPSF